MFKFVPEQDNYCLAEARQILGPSDPDGDINDDVSEYWVSGRRSAFMLPTPIVNQALRVQIRQSSYLDIFFHVWLVVDSGATDNMIRTSTAVLFIAKIRSSSKSSHQANVFSPLTFVGDTKLHLIRDGHVLYFKGLVIANWMSMFSMVFPLLGILTHLSNLPNGYLPSEETLLTPVDPVHHKPLITRFAELTLYVIQLPQPFGLGIILRLILI